MPRLAAAVILPLAVATGCATTGANVPTTGRSLLRPTPPALTSAHSHPTTNWTTYHRTNGRSGYTTDTISTPLHHSWTRDLDGAVYGEPLVIGSTLIAATENDSVYGLSARTGQVRWRTHLATPASQSDIQGDLPGCGNVFPLGITGTPAYDATTGSVFVIAESTHGHHTLWSLNAANGHRRWHRSTDVLRSRDRRAEQQRSALLVSGGRVFTTYGGLSGDCGNYVGYVTSTPTTGRGPTRHYAVPTAREAGMWSPAGPVTGANRNIYVASGNGAEVNGKWDKSDSVTELSPTSLHRLAVFAPAVWKQDNLADLDLGSSSPIPVAGRIVIAGKRGVVYLLRTSLGGVGHELDATSDGSCSAYGGGAHVGHTVVMPCMGGIRALTVGKRSLHWRWTADGLYGSPVIAGQRVYLADRDTGDLKVLRLSSGHEIASIHAGSLTHFPSEVVDGNHIFVSTLSGITAIRGS